MGTENPKDSEEADKVVFLRQIEGFQQTVLAYYQEYGRHGLPWRRPEADGSFDPYKVLVSEVMLQQTQVPRVVPKFEQFLAQFPSCMVLARAPLAEVLKAWSGLGYNRRAKFLWQAAQKVANDYKGVLPATTAELTALPGVGSNTAGALLAYAYNKPAIFIETNIRTVFIHHFFPGQEQVSDKDIVHLVASALPDDVRSWYWGLMDYGTYLKQEMGNVSVRSRHYKKQSTFQGSRRQIRGQVLRVLSKGPATFVQLRQQNLDERLPEVLAALVNEGMIALHDNWYTLYDA